MRPERQSIVLPAATDFSLTRRPQRCDKTARGRGTMRGHRSGGPRATCSTAAGEASHQNGCAGKTTCAKLDAIRGMRRSQRRMVQEKKRAWMMRRPGRGSTIIDWSPSAHNCQRASRFRE
ncbi:unnamed protein product [Prorocentrum cordatum]|uniref:Uncharacterized protein n=1 Tax=Prorocentrum cordatum TaxID=2364126 RepID=A0ABN9TU92_9DINO|nr:unnamed protein product [Polarella glacialis]